MEILQFGTSPHTHQISEITSFRTENPSGFNFNNQQNSGFYSVQNAPNAPVSGWVNSIICRHPNGAVNSQLQLAASLFNNTDFFIRSLYADDGVEEWRKIAVESTSTWTPTIGGTLSNGTSHNYTTQAGRWFRQGSSFRVQFQVKGTFSSTANRPTGSPTIRGLPFAAKNEVGFWWSNIPLHSNIGAEGVSGIPVFAIKHNENFIRLQLNDAGLNGNAEYMGVNSNIWGYAGGSFDFAGDLIYEIA